MQRTGLLASAVVAGGLLLFSAIDNQSFAGSSAVNPAAGRSFSEYEFPDYPAGSSPSGGLIIDKNGVLYGTTSSGGGEDDGVGTIFQLAAPSAGDPSWHETPLFVFRFENGEDPDGYGPQDLTYAGLEAGTPYDATSPLFGFATQGGLNYQTAGGATHDGNGTVFMFNPPGSALANQCSFVRLHSFSSDFDGIAPYGLTVGPDGAVYGVTAIGGSTANMSGVVFRLSPRNPDNLCSGWAYHRIYEFDSTASFGDNPTGGLAFAPDGSLLVAVNLGAYGGIIRLKSPANPNRSWKPFIVYQATDSQFGTNPQHMVFDSAGNLYAGTKSGGRNTMGTVFRLVPRRGNRVPWTPQLVYSFGDNPDDGQNVSSHLAFGPDGALYGTTQYGGATDCGKPQYSLGCGTAFKLTPSPTNPRHLPWTETKLHDFSGTDGAGPKGNIAFGVDGTLYSTTNWGDPDYPATFTNGYAYAIGP